MIGRRTWTKPASIAMLAAVYGVATAAGYFVAEALADSNTLLAGFVADLVATAVVFAGAVALNNTSVYDPYWSVAPILLGLWWLLQGDEISGTGIVVVAVIALWGIRLTANFLAGWTGLNHEDWRYTEYRRFGTIGYWAMSYAGLHMVPTLVVFAGMLPVHAATTGDAGFGALGVAGAALALLAIWIESTADLQKRRFRNSGGSGVLIEGLWSLVRHPNYLGEIGFWWGLALFGIAAGEAWTVAGALAVTLLFAVISIPLMDRRMEQRRPGYRTATGGLPALVPSLRSAGRWFSRTTWRT